MFLLSKVLSGWGQEALTPRALVWKLMGVVWCVCVCMCLFTHTVVWVWCVGRDVGMLEVQHDNIMMCGVVPRGLVLNDCVMCESVHIFVCHSQHICVQFVPCVIP